MSRKNNLLSEAEISSFCHQILMIIKAGLPPYYGVSILRDETVEEDMKALLSTISEPLEQGASLYEAISQTNAFPDYMLQMIKIGEETGRLEEVLSSLSVYYEREAEIREGIKRAVTYPIIMSIMMLAVIIVIIVKVVPIFATVYAELGSNLSGSAKLLMDISTFLNQYLLILIGICIAIGIIMFIISKTSIWKHIWDRRGIALSLASSRLANCMYLALASGLDTDQGLSLAESLVNNNYMNQRIRKCKELLSSGESFSRALLLSSCFSEMYSSMIVIGYKTSAMDEVMLRVSKAYEKETDEKLHQFVSIIEPSLIIVLSFFIGLILISFLLPLLGIMSSIG